MATASDLREHILDLLWSQWHELGVSSTVARRHTKDWIDPEPLIAFTAIHSDLDPRLRDESIDWVLQYGAYVSRARLKNIVSDWDMNLSRFSEFAATVNAHGGAGWPSGKAKALAFRPRSRALLSDLGPPALLSLRLRAVFGVGARAELIRALLSRPHSSMTAAELALETSYRKRNVLNELEPLRFGGVVGSFRAANTDRYSLTKSKELESLFGPMPSRYTHWTAAFAALGLILALAQQAQKRGDLSNSVDAVRLLEEHKETFVAATMYAPALPSDTSAWPRFLEWAVGHARAFAGT